MQEGNLGKVRACTPVLVRRLLARRRIRIDPSLRQEIVATLAPELRAAVDCVRAQEEPGPRGHGLPGHNGVTDGFTDGHRHRGIETQDFLADAVEEGEGLQIVPGDGGVTGGNAFADFSSHSGLVLGIERQEIAAPGESAGGCFVLYGSRVSFLYTGCRRRRRAHTPAAKNVNI